jgi:2-polyprenyl-6-hydroxyphenyl methylase / 3-demethylubiquinone-9 3-methyltransferase
MAFKKSRPETLVNNEIYDEYGERWYTAKDDPVALLRAEARARYGWIVSELTGRYSSGSIHILDVGCGAGFLANPLALNGYRVTGLDASKSALEVARNHDTTRTVDYRHGDAYKLEFDAGIFDVVCAMDFLEHVEYPDRVVQEVARVLKPGGSFFFYTFNRNLLAWLIVIKGVEWFIRNTPRRMHRLNYFIKPAEMRRMCFKNRMSVVRCCGLAPKIFQTAFWKMLVTGAVEDRFTFSFTRHQLIGYIGIAVRDQSDCTA